MRRGVLTGAGLMTGAAFLALGTAVAAAAADVGSGHVNDFDVDVEVRHDGVLEVHESITYDFDGFGHGILRSIPYRYRWDDTDDRETELGAVTVTSRTAPVDVQTARQDGQLVLRIGDPDRLIRGTHTYELDYTVAGALNDRDDHAELAWSGVGHQWRTRIDRASIQVSAPALLGARCFLGPVGSDTSCGTATRDGVEVEDGQATVAFGPERLRSFEAMTVYADLASGSVQVAPPVLVERWSLRRAFSVTPLSVGLAIGLLALGTWAVRRLARRGRDEQAAGGGPAGADVPVDWRAVREMRPGPLGTLVDERADVVDVTATIVDLAVRGHLRIEELGRHMVVWRDWRLVRLENAPDDLVPFERALLDKLFGVGVSGRRSEVRLSELKDTFADSMNSLRRSLEAEVVRRGWFRDRPGQVRLERYLTATVALVAALGVAALLVAFTELGLVGVALVLSPAALLLTAHRMPARTSAGSAAKQQAEALRHYLATAMPGGPQHADENAHGFSAMLPYAMVLGLEERWTRTFAALAALPHGTARSESGPQWYVGPSVGTPFAGQDDFGSAISSFSWAAGKTMTSRPPSSASAGDSSTGDSSGGGWFGGGSSGGGSSGGGAGGGGGGGGGGGW
jgi:uncharacterized membrane protein YgcG